MCTQRMSVTVCIIILTNRDVCCTWVCLYPLINTHIYILCHLCSFFPFFLAFSPLPRRCRPLYTSRSPVHSSIRFSIVYFCFIKSCLFNVLCKFVKYLRKSFSFMLFLFFFVFVGSFTRSLPASIISLLASSTKLTDLVISCFLFAEDKVRKKTENKMK